MADLPFRVKNRKTGKYDHKNEARIKTHNITHEIHEQMLRKSGQSAEEFFRRQAGRKNKRTEHPEWGPDYRHTIKILDIQRRRKARNK